MRLIRWTTEAADQLEAAVKRIQQDNPTAARNVAQAVIDRIEQLATLPRPWPTGRNEGNPRTRQPALRGCVYRSTEEIVEILYIWHGAQDWR